MQDRHLSDKRKTVFRQRGSGHLAVPGWFSDTEPGVNRSSHVNQPTKQTGGVADCTWTEHLNSAAIGKVLCATAKVRTGFGKSDHPGSQGGLGKRGHGGTVNPLRNRKGGAGNPPPKRRRAPALSRPYRKGGSDSILALSLAGDIARWRLKRRQRGAADKAANLAG